jgi:hypothetical protein
MHKKKKREEPRGKIEINTVKKQKLATDLKVVIQKGVYIAKT